MEEGRFYRSATIPCRPAAFLSVFALCAELECIKWGASRDQIRYPLSGHNDVTMQVGDLILVSGRLLLIIFCD